MCVDWVKTNVYLYQKTQWDATHQEMIAVYRKLHAKKVATNKRYAKNAEFLIVKAGYK